MFQKLFPAKPHQFTYSFIFFACRKVATFVCPGHFTTKNPLNNNLFRGSYISSFILKLQKVTELLFHKLQRIIDILSDFSSLVNSSVAGNAVMNTRENARITDIISEIIKRIKRSCWHSQIIV